MKLLSQLLPGVRDLRTPLAVGVLWSLFFVLTEPRLPTEVRTAVASTSAQLRVFLDFVPSVVHTTLLALAVYLVGVLLSYISQGIVRAVGLIVDRRILVLLIVFAVAVGYPVLLLIVGSGLALVIAVVATLAYLRSESRNLSDFLSPITELLAAGLAAAGAALSGAIESIAAASSTERRERSLFIREDTSRRVATSPFMQNRLVEGIQGQTLIKALSYLEVKFEREKLVPALQSPYIRKVGKENLDRIDIEESYGLSGDVLNAYLDNVDSPLLINIANGTIGRWRDFSNEDPPYVGPTASRVFKSLLLEAIQNDPEVARRFVWQFTSVSLPLEF